MKYLRFFTSGRWHTSYKMRIRKLEFEAIIDKVKFNAWFENCFTFIGFNGVIFTARVEFQHEKY